MSTTGETEILDRLYTAIGEGRKWAFYLADPARLRMVVAKTDYEHLYDALEYIEGCARQMTAWREDTRWLMVSRTVGQLLVNIRDWVTPGNIGMFIAVVRFLDSTEHTCQHLQHQATGRVGAILPDEVRPRGSHELPKQFAVSRPNMVAGTKAVN